MKVKGPFWGQKVENAKKRLKNTHKSEKRDNN